jgi:F-type H+-transporting ATPase subunit b
MRILLTVAILLGAGLMLPAPSATLFAADAPNKGQAEGKKAEGGDPHAAAPHKTEDPLAFTGIKRYDLGIYTLIVFGLLYVILKTFAWGPISEGLQKREDLIRSERETAEQARAEAQKYLDEAKAILARSHDDARLIVEEARRDGQVLRERLQTEGKAEVQAERERLRREIETARDQALQEIWIRTVEISTQVSSRAVRRSMTPDDHARVLSESMTELKSGLGTA